MALVDTGEIGPWGTKAWLAGSYQEYDKFKVVSATDSRPVDADFDNAANALQKLPRPRKSKPRKP